MGNNKIYMDNNKNTTDARKLVTVRKVSNIIPIPNADLIEILKIDGWQCVSKKGEFKVGDYCVYFEIDSFLPEVERFEFLRKSCYREWKDGKEEYKGFRLKTIKLRGEISQGLALPISILSEKMQKEETLNTLYEKRIDIASQLNVIKYDPPLPINLCAEPKGLFPSFLEKTDQERIQNVWEEYKEKYNDLEFEVTLKMNGTSFTAYLYEGKYGICSRNLELKTGDEGIYNKVSNEWGIEYKLRRYGHNLAIQGEIVGGGVQGDYEKLGLQCFIFDIYDIDKKQYLTPGERERVLDRLNVSLTYEELMDLQTPEVRYAMEPPKVTFSVEEIFRLDRWSTESETRARCELLTQELAAKPYKYVEGIKQFFLLMHVRRYPPAKLSQFNSVEDLLFFCEGPSLRNPQREGLVFKSKERVNGKIISFKGISNKFLQNCDAN